MCSRNNKVNPGETRTVQYTTQFEDGNLSKIKTSTLFPDNWSDKNIIDSINQIVNTNHIVIMPYTFNRSDSL
ncbi:EndoU domain-containing protein [Gilliamella apicola]|uniref:Bacterial EndoU nuclease domain-containing protein n=1 Tax=Gilliamella apicola TaxID=1196095 RepID=A0A2V4E6F8_9GAMM|nr:hypothetical protein DKK79_06200 [Gilliamella apicola]